MRDRISRAMVASVTVLSLAARAEPVSAQSGGAPGWQDGGRGWPPTTIAPGAPGGPPVVSGRSAPYFGAPDWSDDPCWQVRPIYSVSGAWLNNQRVNVCH
jgi:hypothetical protein